MKGICQSCILSLLLLHYYNYNSWLLLLLLVVQCCAPGLVVCHRLNMLHEVLSEMAASPRVMQCAQVVPVLLHVFFNNITKVNVSGQWYC